MRHKGIFRNRRRSWGTDPEYKKFLQSLPCMLCELKQQQQKSRTEVAHCGQRGISQKCDDREALPLCHEHHDEGPESQHTLGKGFWLHHDIDRPAAFRYYQERFFDQVGRMPL